MKNPPAGINFLFKQPGAWIPMAISACALAGIAAYVAVFGLSRNGTRDEGAPARIFQCVMAMQLPVIGGFALRWLPKRPAQALIILALQAAAWMIPILIILWLESL